MLLSGGRRELRCSLCVVRITEHPFTDVHDFEDLARVKVDVERRYF